MPYVTYERPSPGSTFEAQLLHNTVGEKPSNTKGGRHREDLYLPKIIPSNCAISEVGTDKMSIAEQ